jgi:hypothetical protein
MIEAEAPKSVAQITDCLPTLLLSWRPKVQKTFVYPNRFFKGVDQMRPVPACPKHICQLLQPFSVPVAIIRVKSLLCTRCGRRHYLVADESSRAAEARFFSSSVLDASPAALGMFMLRDAAEGCGFRDSKVQCGRERYQGHRSPNRTVLAGGNDAARYEIGTRTPAPKKRGKFESGGLLSLKISWGPGHRACWPARARRLSTSVHSPSHPPAHIHRVL